MWFESAQELCNFVYNFHTLANATDGKNGRKYDMVNSMCQKQRHWQITRENQVAQCIDTLLRYKQLMDLSMVQLCATRCSLLSD